MRPYDSTGYLDSPAAREPRTSPLGLTLTWTGEGGMSRPNGRDGICDYRTGRLFTVKFPDGREGSCWTIPATRDDPLEEERYFFHHMDNTWRKAQQLGWDDPTVWEGNLWANRATLSGVGKSSSRP